MKLSAACAPAGTAEQQLVSADALASVVQTLTPGVPISVSLPQPQTPMPITVQGCPQVMTALVSI